VVLPETVFYAYLHVIKFTSIKFEKYFLHVILRIGQDMPT
jgi:hypothetical protein